MSYLFSKQQDPTQAATKTACSKLSNNAALVVHELAREPAQGLMHVATHVQRSIPALLATNHQLETAAAQLQAVLAELQDAQEGILSITGPATQQDLAALAASLESAAQQLEQQHQQQHQQQQQQQQQGAGATRTAASTGNSRLLKLFAAGASGSSSPAGSVQGS